MMNIEVLFFEACPSHPETVDLVHRTIDRLGIDATVTEVNVRTDAEAKSLKFLGSPSVRVDGVDIESSAKSSTSYGRRCRLYSTPEGLSGTPPVRMLEAALTGSGYDVEVTDERSGGCCATSDSPRVQLLVADWCPQCPAAETFWSELQDREPFDLEIIDIESKRGSALAAAHGIRVVPAAIVDDRVEFRGTPVPSREAARRCIRGR
jgi:hypothetical protein